MNIKDNMVISQINYKNNTQALKLVQDVFMKYEACDYPEQGVKTFINSVINNQDYLDSLTMYGVFFDNNVIGVIATRNNASHIAFFC